MRNYTFDLPKALLQHELPAERDACRLMVVDGKSIVHTEFRNLKRILAQDDELWVNDSQVNPSRIDFFDFEGARHSCTLLENVDGVWRIWAELPSELPPGKVIETRDLVQGKVAARRGRIISCEFDGPIDRHELCEIVLPWPHRPIKISDRAKYETVYAGVLGSIGFPSAGWHFTEELLRQFSVVPLTLHVAFENEGSPIQPEKFRVHKTPDGPVVAVGTTVAKALETWASEKVVSGESNLEIEPGWKFQATKALLTNLHLSGESHLKLACALGGYDNVMRAYRAAIEQGYKWNSYGDLMLVFQAN